MLTKTSDIYSDLLRPEFEEWKIVAHDKIEKFDPLTLIGSFIESEMELDYAFTLFDIVVEKINSIVKLGDLKHSDIHNAVSQSLLESDHPESQKYLSNYDINFGPDLNELSTDEGFINIRHAKSLKNVILEILSKQTGKMNEDALEEYLGADELRTITNRLIKIIRFCGFYKVKKTFLISFFEELSCRSVKSILPNYMSFNSVSENEFIKIHRLITMAQIESRSEINTAINFLEIALEELASLSLRKFGLLPLSSTRRSFKQLIDVIKTIGEIKNRKTFIPEYQKIKTQILEAFNTQSIPIQSLSNLCDDLQNSIEKRFAIRACRQAIRLLRNLKIILKPEPALLKLNSYNYSIETQVDYIKTVTNYFVNSGYYIKNSSNEYFIDLNINFEYHELIEFGRVIRFRFCFTTDDEDFSNDWLNLSVEDIKNNKDIISVIVTNTDIPVNIIYELNNIVENYHRCICILGRDQFERGLRRPEEIRDVILSQFEKLIPSAKDFRGKIFQPNNLILPDNIKEYEIQSLKDSIALIQKDSGSEACLQLSRMFESSVREYIMMIYSLYNRGLRDKKFATEIYFDLEGINFKTLIKWIENLRKKILYNKDLKNIILPFLPDKSLISEIDRLRVNRNDYIHMNREVIKNEAEVYFNKISIVIKELSKITKQFQRGIFIRRLHSGVEVYADEGLININGKRLHEANLHLHYGCCIYISNETNFFPIIHAAACCNECYQISLLDQANASGSCLCSNCRKSIPLERGWHILVKKSNADKMLPRITSTKKCFSIKKDEIKNMNKKSFELQNETSTQPKRRLWLRTIAETVATAVGPAGAPIKGILALQDSIEEEKFDLKIETIISEQRQLKTDLFNKFFFLEEKVNRFRDIITQTIIDQIEILLKASNDPKVVYTQLANFDSWAFVSLTNINRDKLIEELVQLYNLDNDLFFTDLYRSGYKTSRIKRTGTLEADISYFVASLKGQSPFILLKTFEFLQSKFSGSLLLNDLVNQLKTISSSGLLVEAE